MSDTPAGQLRAFAEHLIKLSEKAESVEINVKSGATYSYGKDGWQRVRPNGTYSFEININGGARYDYPL